MRIISRPGPAFGGNVLCVHCRAYLEWEGHDIRRRTVRDEETFFVVCAVCDAHCYIPNPPERIAHAVRVGEYHPKAPQ